jgi:xanthine dehydrogenase accessory factor
VTYGVTKEEAARFGLPCGGNLRLVQEPLQDTAWIAEVLARTARHELVARRLDFDTGAVTVEAASRGEVFEFTGSSLRALYGPRWRLLIIGAGQLSRALAPMALALDFEVICCDPREEYHLTWDVPGTTFSRSMPDDVVHELQLDPHCAVVAVTHDPKLDDMVLLEALKSPAFYVGALGSRGNTAKRQERLKLFDLSDAEIGRLHGPIGLHLGARTPAEIAVSIAAEIVAVKNGVDLAQKKAGSALPAASHVCTGHCTRALAACYRAAAQTGWPPDGHRRQHFRLPSPRTAMNPSDARPGRERPAAQGLARARPPAAPGHGGRAGGRTRPQLRGRRGPQPAGHAAPAGALAGTLEAADVEPRHWHKRWPCASPPAWRRACAR